MPERLPPALMADLEKRLTAASTANLQAMEAGLRNYLASDRCAPQLKNALASYEFKVVPKIVAYLPAAKK